MTSASTVPVCLRGVSKRYGSTTAVSDLALDVHCAEVLALLGPNGAGKTTTVEMCEGFIKPDAGTIEILGFDPVADNARVRERIGVMLQGGGGYPAARAGEMLDLVAAYAAIGIENAIAIRTAAGIASRPSHELTAPKAATTTRYAALAVSTRVSTTSWWPISTSCSVSGVAVIA